MLQRSAGVTNNSSSSSFLRQLMMESVLAWAMLLALCGFQTHAAGVTTPTIQVRRGEDATFHCPLLDTSNLTTAVRTAGLAAHTTLSWYRKAPGQGPTLLVSLGSVDRSRVKYGHGVRRDKVSAAADGSLLLRASEQSDSAVYYCGISRGNEREKGPVLRARRRK